MKKQVKIYEVAPISQSSENISSEKVWLLNLDMIESNTGKILEFQYFTKKELGSSISQFNNENVLYSKLRPYLNKVVVPEQSGFCTSELVTFKPNKDVLDRYYFSAFLRSRYFVEYINSKSSGAKMPRANMDALKNAMLPLPPLPEQQKIAHHLDTIQSAIDNKKQQLQELDELVKSKYYSLFDDLECDISNIESTCVMKSGTTFSKDDELANGEILYIKVSGMNLEGNEKYITRSLSYVTKKTAGKTLIPANSIIFPKRGGAIGTNKKRITTSEICIDLNIMAVTPSTKLNIQYLYQYFQELDMGKLYNGAAVPQINNKDIGPLEIKLPPIDLQNTFAAFVQKIDTAKSIVKNQLVDLNELLDSKMDEYFG